MKLPRKTNRKNATTSSIAKNKLRRTCKNSTIKTKIRPRNCMEKPRNKMPRNPTWTMTTRNLIPRWTGKMMISSRQKINPRKRRARSGSYPWSPLLGKRNPLIRNKMQRIRSKTSTWILNLFRTKRPLQREKGQTKQLCQNWPSSASRPRGRGIKSARRQDYQRRIFQSNDHERSRFENGRVDSAMTMLEDSGSAANLQLFFIIGDGKIERKSRSKLRKLVRELTKYLFFSHHGHRGGR